MLPSLGHTWTPWACPRNAVTLASMARRSRTSSLQLQKRWLLRAEAQRIANDMLTHEIRVAVATLAATVVVLILFQIKQQVLLGGQVAPS